MGFLQFLGSLASGRTASLLDAEMEKVRDAVAESGKAASLTVTIEVKPVSKSNWNSHIIVAKIASKLPVAPGEDTVVYVAADGLYSQYDPRQPVLPAFASIKGGGSAQVPSEDQASG